MGNSVKIEKFHLEDGRIAERHISTNEAGERIIEVYAEEQRPYKLEKRITEKRKEVLAEQNVETIKNGEVVEMKVTSVEPTKLQLVNHIAKADSGLHASPYVSKQDLSSVVADAVVAGVSTLLNQQGVKRPLVTQNKLQALVEEKVENKQKTDMTTIVIMGVLIVAQLAFFGYIMFMM